MLPSDAPATYWAGNLSYDSTIRTTRGSGLGGITTLPTMPCSCGASALEYPRMLTTHHPAHQPVQPQHQEASHADAWAQFHSYLCGWPPAPQLGPPAAVPSTTADVCPVEPVCNCPGASTAGRGVTTVGHYPTSSGHWDRTCPSTWLPPLPLPGALLQSPPDRLLDVHQCCSH